MDDFLTKIEALSYFNLNGVKSFKGKDVEVTFNFNNDTLVKMTVVRDSVNNSYTQPDLIDEYGDEDYTYGIFSVNDGETIIFTYSELKYDGTFKLSFMDSEDWVDMSPSYYVTKDYAASIFISNTWFEYKKTTEGVTTEVYVSFGGYDYETGVFNRVWYKKADGDEVSADNAKFKDGEDISDYVNWEIVDSGNNTIFEYSDLSDNGTFTIKNSNNTDYKLSPPVFLNVYDAGRLLSNSDSTIFIHGDNIIEFGLFDNDNETFDFVSINEGGQITTYKNVGVKGNENIRIDEETYTNYISGDLFVKNNDVEEVFLSYKIGVIKVDDINSPDANNVTFGSDVYNKKEFEYISLYQRKEINGVVTEEEINPSDDIIELNNVQSEGETIVKKTIYVRVEEDKDNNSFSTKIDGDFCVVDRNRNEVTLLLENNYTPDDRYAFITFTPNMHPNNSVTLVVKQKRTEYSLDLIWKDSTIVNDTIYYSSNGTFNDKVATVNCGGGSEAFYVEPEIKRYIFEDAVEEEKVQLDYDGGIKIEKGKGEITIGIIDRLGFIDGINKIEIVDSGAEIIIQYIITLHHKDIVGVKKSIIVNVYYEQNEGKIDSLVAKDDGSIKPSRAPIKPLPKLPTNITPITPPETEKVSIIPEKDYGYTLECPSEGGDIIYRVEVLPEEYMLTTMLSGTPGSLFVRGSTYTVVTSSTEPSKTYGEFKITIEKNNAKFERCCYYNITAPAYPYANLKILIIQAGASDDTNNQSNG